MKILALWGNYTPFINVSTFFHKNLNQDTKYYSCERRKIEVSIKPTEKILKGLKKRPYKCEMGAQSLFS